MRFQNTSRARTTSRGTFNTRGDASDEIDNVYRGNTLF